MEKIQDMQNNMISDEELEQVGGGSNVWGAFRAKFFDSEEDIVAQNLLMTDEDKKNGIGVSTLEMRVDPKKKKGSRLTRL